MAKNEESFPGANRGESTNQQQRKSSILQAVK
jgi:hypothetical protein